MTEVHEECGFPVVQDIDDDFPGLWIKRCVRCCEVVAIEDESVEGVARF